MEKDILKACVSYDPETGIILPKYKYADAIVLGRELGCKDERSGYIIIKVFKKTYFAHQIAFHVMTGRIPDLIDHKDNNGFNNKWSNLREATKQTNAMNARIRKDNSTGVKGISWEERANGFQARVAINGKSTTKRFSVSKHKTKELALCKAEEWVRSIRLDLHGEFTNHG